MSILGRLRRPPRQRVLLFEVTQRCNQACLFCYNVWQADPAYPRGELDTADTKRLIRKAVRESGCRLLTFTGGEPLLRAELEQLVVCARDLGAGVNVITNGTLLTEARIASLLRAGVSLFEVPLNSVERAVHDRLAGGRVSGAFDRVTEAIVDIKLQGGQVVAVFVATRLNIPALRETLELAFALGADGVMLNRFNVGGLGIRNRHELLPTPEELAGALAVADEAAAEFGLPVSCSVPIPPCVVDTSRFPHLGFGFCAAGTENAYFTMDPLGNVRICNHIPTLLGNLRRHSFARIVRSAQVAAFCGALPERCAGCQHAEQCKGGCKAAALVCYGSLQRCDPLVEERVPSPAG